jgi:hypothetical protein
MRAKAYAAKLVEITVPMMLNPDIRNEFRKKSPNVRPRIAVHPSLKLPNSHSRGSRFTIEKISLFGFIVLKMSQRTG